MEGKPQKTSNKLPRLSRREADAMETLVEDYIDFASRSKTPELARINVLNEAKSHGFVEYEEGMKWPENKPGVYMVDETGRQFVIIKSPPRMNQQQVLEGLSFVVSHLDAPGLNLNTKPIIEEGDKTPQEGVLLGTRAYGGIWPHNWVDAEVQVIGTMRKGRYLDKTLTLDGLIFERGIHVSRAKVYDKKVSEAFPHDMLKVATGYPNREAFLRELKRQGFSEEDFGRGTFWVVPASPAKRVGDLISAYGNDDHCCLFPSVRALFSAENTKYPVVIYGCAREEIGSTGPDGAQSNFLDRAIDNFLILQGMPIETISGALTRRLFGNSRLISSDVDVALTTCDKEFQEASLASKLGSGVVMVKSNGGIYQGGGTRASDQMTSYMMDLLNGAGVNYQLSELPTKQEHGGGGTIAIYLVKQIPHTIDMGLPTANMHGKYPAVHKRDMLEAFYAYRAFMERKA